MPSVEDPRYGLLEEIGTREASAPGADKSKVPSPTVTGASRRWTV